MKTVNYSSSSEHIVIRVATPSDAESLLAVYAPYVRETTITFETQVPSVAQFQSRIQSTLSRFPYLVAQGEGGQIVGYSYAGTFKARAAYDWAAELSVYVDRDFRGHHAGTLLCNEIEKILRRQNVVTLAAGITQGNMKSLQFHHDRGFEQVADFKNIGFKLGAWLDVLWLQKSLSELPAQPRAFIPFPQVENPL